jgi:hypothetical protein
MNRKKTEKEKEIEKEKEKKRIIKRKKHKKERKNTAASACGPHAHGPRAPRPSVMLGFLSLKRCTVIPHQRRGPAPSRRRRRMRIGDPAPTKPWPRPRGPLRHPPLRCIPSPDQIAPLPDPGLGRGEGGR